jgi:hypothetical protein
MYVWTINATGWISHWSDNARRRAPYARLYNKRGEQCARLESLVGMFVRVDVIHGIFFIDRNELALPSCREVRTTELESDTLHNLSRRTSLETSELERDHPPCTTTPSCDAMRPR